MVGLLVSDVTNNGDGSAAACSYLGDELIKQFRTPGIDHHSGAGASETLRRSPADPRARTSNNCDLTFQKRHRVTP
jgi:hypothetical protein